MLAVLIEIIHLGLGLTCARWEEEWREGGERVWGVEGGGGGSTSGIMRGIDSDMQLL